MTGAQSLAATDESKMNRGARIRRVWIIAVSLVVIGAALAPLPSAQALEVTIAPVRQVGGPGHAQLYGWGMATAIDGTILIGDYWNFRIERYATDGTYLGTVIQDHGKGETQHQTPYGIATDPNNGDIVFGDVDGMQLPSSTELFGYGVDKYTNDGTYLTSWGTKYVWGQPEVGTFAYPSYVAVASSGNIYVTDQRRHNVVAHTSDGTELFQIGDNKAGTGQGQFKQPRGIAFDAQDRLFVADNANQRIQVFEADGTFLYEFGEAGTEPGQLGNDMRQIAVDKTNEWLYVVDTTQGMTSKFELDGTYLTRWGGWGNTEGKFVAGGRGVTVDFDGNVWVGDMGGFRAQKFDSDGNFLLQVPEAPTAPPDGGFNQPRGVALGPDGDIFVTDTHNWRIQRFNPDGSFASAFGTRGSDEYKFNYPRGISIDQTDGGIVVADTDNHRIKRYTDDGTFQWALGGYGPGDGQFKTPHSVDVGPDGTIYVADSLNQRIVKLDQAGNVIGSFGAKGSGDAQHQFVRGVDYDDSDGTIWLTDSVRGRVNHWTVDGTWLGAFGAVGSEDHQLLRAADIETDAEYVYVADTDSDKIKVWRKDGTFVGAFDGGPGETKLQRPHGLDLVGDRLYVVEQTGERVQEFLITTGGEPDTTPPDATVVAPAPGSIHPSIGTLTMTGDASDDAGVASVRVAIKDVGTGLWWTGADWGVFTYLTAELSDPGSTLTTWTMDWDPPGAGEYGMLVEARDASANPDPTKPWVAFSVYAGLADAVEPDASITIPAKGASYPDSLLQFAGDATDDASGVSGVDVAIKDTAAGMWWTGTGWDSAIVFHSTTLDNAGALVSDWHYDWTPPAPGSYGILVRATDVAGNADSTKPWRGFTVIPSGADMEPPDVTVATPVKGGIYPLAQLMVSGEATDAESGVTAVDVAVKNTDTNLWWTGSGWGAFTFLPAVVDDPDALLTTWSMTWTPPAAGSFGVLVRATDAAGNINPVKPWHGFSIED